MHAFFSYSCKNFPTGQHLNQPPIQMLQHDLTSEKGNQH